MLRTSAFHSLSFRVLRLAFWFLLCSAGSAVAQTSKEHEIKAVLILNLARFVDWPEAAFASPESPIVIGVVGRNPFGQALENAVAGEQVNGRKITIEHFANLRSKPCHILFISDSEKGRVQRILSAVAGRPVLTVSEIDGFTTSLGGMVRLYVNEQNKVRVQVNLESARSNGLRLSSKLLQVAEVTRK
jgi:hypothetical protein